MMVQLTEQGVTEQEEPSLALEQTLRHTSVHTSGAKAWGAGDAWEQCRDGGGGDDDDDDEDD